MGIRSRRWPAARAILAVAVAASLAVSGCSMDGAKSADTKGPDATVRVNSTEPQSGLVPSDTNEKGGGQVIEMLFDGLYDYRPDGTPELANAESVETTDNQNFLVKLKRDWTFTDGTPVKASNYVRAWNFGASGKNLQKQQDFFAPIEGFDEVKGKDSPATEMRGLRVIDDYTFSIRLAAPNIDFKLALGFYPFSPLPDVFFTEGKEKFGQNPVGNGPYKLKQWRHNVQLEVVRNAEYKGTKPKNGGITFIMYESYDAAYTDILSGNLDLQDELPDSALGSFRKTFGDRAITRPTAQTQSFVIPQFLEHFGPDEEGRLRRQAISMSINRPQIIEKVFRGMRNPSVDFTAQAIPGWRADLPGNETVKYNPELAKQRWAQANAIKPWTGAFQIAYNSDGGHKVWVDAVTNQVKNTLGIEASGKPYATFKQIRDELTKKTLTAAGRNGWQGDYPTQLNFLVPNYVTGGGSNDGDYSNPQFDALIDQAESTLDPVKSTELVNRAQEILLRDLPIVPMWDYIQAAVLGEGVRGELTWNGRPDYPNMTKE
ncbi:Stage 0 sporulation protein KA (plasmid) [Tsukamurella tyrosinosolvens]|uniref:Oligopeptide transport system substrate-binding protein n=2 Tax=Tsukamurella tyrosinosolvens TaxID=57704 RepID=A0A1H5BP46_TSUTY|nr:oligopeptide transport system substrate-binding protein [Tsukamurella tyrosinosolvens]VEI01723.1 Stage 0 sporulation protein KA [Tsukamurella tyrosinosolvens]